MVVRIKILPVFYLLLFVLVDCNNRSNVEDKSKTLNRLINAQSPYLQQHADNPVDWYEWGEEALERAKKENKLLIISIGYSSCHWCHVMERESFMDTAVANVMNKNFVSIKIDREERPDIDQLYLEAAQLISGNSGWPLNAFALPDGKPIYAATYFTKEQWLNMLNNVLDVYKNENRNIVKQAYALTEKIRSVQLATIEFTKKEKSNPTTFNNIFFQWQASFDTALGGVKGAPKFPMPGVWEFLLQTNYLTADTMSLKTATVTLDAMAKGGIYDQIGGGFSRYSTDEQWSVPHFEKMLYDNAQLVSLYAHAYQVTRDPLYRQIVLETLVFIRREMTAANGGFYTSINADSEGEEGKFYVWTKDEIARALDKETSGLILDYYQVTDSGNWENQKNILHTLHRSNAFANRHSLKEDKFDALLLNAKASLLEVRARRQRPSTDDKILTSSNALMLKGYIDAYLALADSTYLQSALANAKFLEKNMLRSGGQLWHNYRNDNAGTDAFLDDYALLARSFISLYQATFDAHWLLQSRVLTEYAVKHFYDKQTGMFFYTSDQAENLIARKMELVDNVVPSSNSVMAEVLFVLGEYFQDDSYVEMSELMVGQILSKINDSGPYHANWASVLGLIAYKPFEVAIVGTDAQMKAREMQRQYHPTALFMGGKEENLPLLKNKLVAGRTLIYVCRNKTCRAPQATAANALAELVEYRSSAF